MPSAQELAGGVSLTGYLHGGTASLHFEGPAGKDWNCEAAVSNSNHEALRRALTAALCWLDSDEPLIMPALRGDVVLRAERRGG